MGPEPNMKLKHFKNSWQKLNDLSCYRWIPEFHYSLTSTACGDHTHFYISGPCIVWALNNSILLLDCFAEMDKCKLFRTETVILIKFCTLRYQYRTSIMHISSELMMYTEIIVPTFFILNVSPHVFLRISIELFSRNPMIQGLIPLSSTATTIFNLNLFFKNTTYTNNSEHLFNTNE